MNVALARKRSCEVRQKRASGRVAFCRTPNRSSAQVSPAIYDARPWRSRFLEVDPVEGGSCNDYDYVCGDPINQFDLNGFCKSKKAGLNPWRRVRNAECRVQHGIGAAGHVAKAGATNAVVTGRLAGLAAAWGAMNGAEALVRNSKVIVQAAKGCAETAPAGAFYGGAAGAPFGVGPELFVAGGVLGCVGGAAYGVGGPAYPSVP